tara:strand:+ start:366 stop:830 length:465 start_codon:yes stop_codon:yes gene_type:complete
MFNKYNNRKETNMTKEKTIKQFIKENNLTMNCEYADSNPNMPDSNNMNHYKVTIKRKFKLNGNHLDTRYGFRQMTLHFSQGYGIIGEPTLESVLNCLISDSTCGETFQEFCDNFGYDNDSRKAEKTFNTILKQTSKLKKLLDNNFNDLASCEQL